MRLHVIFGQFLCLLTVFYCRVQAIPRQGRNLLIKAIPPVEDYQSGIYEIFMEPYLYEFGHQGFGPNRAEKQIDLVVPPGTGIRHSGLQAIVHLQPDEDSGVVGDLVFTQLAPNGPVTIQGNITGLTAGLHGIHVHQTGAVKENCKEIGPHFIAYYGRHGGPRDSVRHVGDLGNIKADDDAAVEVKIVDHLISLAGPRSIVGRSIGISKGEDDYGRTGTEDSGLTGTSGPTIACGIIGYLN